jgi:thymidylate synthase (FAD)
MLCFSSDIFTILCVFLFNSESPLLPNSILQDTMSLNPSFANEKKVLDHGYVKLLGVLGDDTSPDNDARISTGSEARNADQQKILLRFLLRHKHTTPFEGSVLKFEVRAPILVIREWFRHRTFSYNEESGRYKQLDPLYYLPDADRVAYQAKSNHQGSGEQHPESESFRVLWKDEQDGFEKNYNDLIQTHNVAKELARLNMPVSHFSTFIVTGNLLNWFRFLQLRRAPNAQEEIRDYADAIAEISSQYFPLCFEAFEDYWMESLSLSGMELQTLRGLFAKAITMDEVNAALPEPSPKFTKREMEEFRGKLRALGIV